MMKYIFSLSGWAGALLLIAACATTNSELAQEFNGRRLPPETVRKVERGQILKLEEVVACSRAGVPDSALITQMSESKAVYKLTTDEIEYLKHSGMSAELIDFMLATVETVGERGPGPKAYGGSSSDSGNVSGGLGLGFGF